MTGEVRKVVINDCFGGFSVSLEAARRMAELGNGIAAQEVAEYDKQYAEFAKTGQNPQWADSRVTVPTSLLESPPRWYGYLYGDNDGGGSRDDPILVQVVEELGGTDAAGEHAHLKVVEIPADVAWHIQEYDGNEHVAEDHRTWSS